MKGYSKIKGSNSFIQRSKSNKEFLFVDKDFDLLSSKSVNKKTQLVDEQEPSIGNEDHIKIKDKRSDFFLREREEYGRQDEVEKNGRGVLKRNFSVSSSANCSYQKNDKSSKLERQSSTRAIQEAVKRAFSMKRSSSVNNSDRYCRIYDQPIIMSNDDDCDYVDDDHVNGNGYGDYNHQDYDNESNGSSETRSGSMIMKNNQVHNNNNNNSHGRRHVGSKVVRACKRLFSR